MRALTEEQRTAFYGKLRAWHAAMGFRGGMDGSYYSGVSQSEPDMLPSLRQHFRTMRTYGGPAPTGQPILHFGECAPLSDPMRYRCVEFGASRFQAANAYANDIKSYIDQAANNKGAAIFVTHNNFESSNTQNLQNLRDMCADVYARSDVEWITLDDYIRSYS
ncbi:hypothetical protein [Rhizobium sp. ZW T2_16]|uniref:hypothetical protein n=1 Tax=Rhizobium sp. ZW T2_16 TaxID=3378083 RepID=UPI0038538D30